jgi:hypothetical protein
MFEQSVAESLVIATLKSVALSHDQMGSMRHVIALAVALLLIVAILVISIAWPELLPCVHGRRVSQIRTRLPPVGRQGADRRAKLARGTLVAVLPDHPPSPSPVSVLRATPSGAEVHP